MWGERCVGPKVKGALADIEEGEQSASSAARYPPFSTHEMDAVLDVQEVDEKWVWRQCHANCEISNLGLTLRKWAWDFGFVSALGSTGFCAGVHTWEMQMTSISRAWVGVAAAENCDLGVSPTFLENAWVMSSIGTRHPDIERSPAGGGRGQEPSFSDMFTSGDTIR
ncbi:hypothetical protein CYMTET_14972 [Cymbomonas tetramitiformis]|uniref:Uncharacterized protein n=1 Tax=Cymbomonas tetramitiformis TaxID=36881 RepID=A0AAE0L9T3_9CHLO|nr:hypothetical protein CYMTET_14972 [Cymbomonas tetramitiformis]